MRNAIRSINKTYNPQFAVIMINKKINDRFFMAGGMGP
jgi:aubergine-like protein